MTSKDIVTLVGLVGLLIYQGTVGDYTGAVQTVLLVAGYLGLTRKADEAKLALAAHSDRIDHRLHTLESVGRNGR